MTTQPTILLVDDFAQDRSLYCRYLKRDPHYDYRVMELETGGAALRFCQHSTPHLIVLSDRLPDMNGLTFINVLKQQMRSLTPPIVMLAEQHDETLVVQAMRSGAQDYLIKNQLTGAILRRSIHSALGQAHLKRQIEYQREQQQLVSAIALRIRQSLHLTEVLHTAVEELRAFLKANWVAVYQFDDNLRGRIVAKSLDTQASDIQASEMQAIDALPLPNHELEETCLQIATTLVSQRYCVLDQTETKTDIAIPILIERQQAEPDYWGVLIAHRSSPACTWNLTDHTLLGEISVQLAIAIYQAELYQQAQTELAERRKAEEALRQAEAMHRIILDAVPDLIIRMKRDGTYLDFRSSKEFPILQPYPNMQGLNLRDIMPPSIVAERLHYVQQALETGKMQVYDYQVQINGQLVWQEARIVVSGEDEVLVIIRDISEQKQAKANQYQAQAELEQQRTLLRTVIDAVPNLIYVKDREGRYILVNRKIADLYETTVEELIGKTAFDFTNNPELIEQFHQENKRVLETQQELFIPEEMQIVRGQERWRQWYKSPFYMSQLDLYAVLAVGVDITERKQAEIALKQLNHELEDRVNARTLALQSINEQLQEEVETRRKTEILLRTSQSRFQKLAANVPGVIYQYLRQPDGCETMPYVSSGMQNLCELDAAAVMQSVQLIWHLIHLEDVPKIKRSIEVSTASMQPWQDEFRITTPSGKLKWIQGIARPERLQNGAILWDGILIDITARKQIENALQQQIERERLIAAIAQRIRETLDLSTILNTTVIEAQKSLAADRVLVCRICDDGGRQHGTCEDETCEDEICQSGNSKAIAEAVKQDLPSLLHLTFPIGYSTPLGDSENYYRYAYNTTERTQSAPFSTLNEFFRQVEVKSAVLVTIKQQGKRWGFLSVHQCHSDREWQFWEIQLLEQLADQLAIAIKQSELYEQLQVELKEREWTQTQLRQINNQLLLTNNQLAQATRMKDEFLANMSHELRTPLNAILGMSEALLDEICGALTDKQKKAITTIERSGNHLLDLINDILDLAKIEAGKLDLQITPVPVKRLCASSLNLISPLALKKNIQLITKIPDRIGGIQVDERRIQQVLINLLDNAIKFTPDGGSVTLEVSVQLAQEPQSEIESVKDAQITFSVIDTGIGIDAENMSFLFQSFMQIDSSLNRQYTGTGLGLALVKRLVELHQGTVVVESTLGKGSRFMVQLPYRCDHDRNKSDHIKS